MTRAADRPRGAVPLVGRPSKPPSGGPPAVVDYAGWLRDLIQEHPRLTNAAIAETIPSKTSSTGHASGTTVADALRGQTSPQPHIVKAIIALRLQDDRHRPREEEIRRKNALLRDLAEQACMPATNQSTARMLRAAGQVGHRELRRDAQIPRPAIAASPATRRAPIGDQRPLAQATKQIAALETELEKHRRTTNEAIEDRDRATSAVHSLRLENAKLRARLKEDEGSRQGMEGKDEVARELDEARDEARRLRQQAQEELDKARTVRHEAADSANTMLVHAERAADDLRRENEQLLALRNALRGELVTLTATVEASMSAIADDPETHQKPPQEPPPAKEPITYTPDARVSYGGSYGSEPYRSDGYGSSPYRSDGYGYGSSEYGTSPYGSDGYGDAGYSSDPYLAADYDYDYSAYEPVDQIGPYPGPGYSGQSETNDPAPGRVVQLVPESTRVSKKSSSGSGRHRRA